MLKEFSVDIQKFFLEVMLTDANCYIRVQGIFNPDNFDRSLRTAATFLQKHTDEYKTIPTLQQISAVSEQEFVRVDDLNDQHIEWFFDEFEKFSRRQELEKAILKSADLIEKGDYDPVEKLIKEAVQIGLVRDMGTDYFADPKSRLAALRNQNGQVATGWESLDRLLYGGFNRGELEIVAAQSGGGKSLIMQNLAVNWLQRGLNGACVTLELSEELYAMRVDSMISGIASREIFKDLDNLELTVRIAAKKYGKFQIKYMPAQSTVNQVRSYVKELMVKTGRPLDFLLIDYLDLLMPSSVKVNPSDFFTKDKFVAEELRNLAKEYKLVLLTAAQFNRSAQEEVEFNHAHISGGISKVNTADNFIGIYTSRAMRERGRYQLQLLKTRNSNGVGQKIDLEFNVDTLRVTDSGEQNDTSVSDSARQILDKIKNTGTGSSPIVNSGPSQASSTKLKQLLGRLGQNNDMT
jgi:archaellum biogenesis ATPase FlaH